ncbi:MAG TPA: ion transporter [Phycisphaerae bacterium]|nr:ion transporter [Phycisphaerae bacterium]
MQLRKRVHEIVDKATAGDRASVAFDIFILSLIFLNVLAIVLESIPEIGSHWAAAFQAFEIASVAVFSVEYLLRLWSCVEFGKHHNPLTGRLRYALSPMALVDLAAVLPFYLPFVGVDLRFVRAVRLLRVFRVAKLGRYSASLQTVGRVFVAKRFELLVTVFVMGILLTVASTVMYYAEHASQPHVFRSIPDSMWWAVATLTTVGYGDAYPVTAFGKLMASIVAILGIGMFALPTGILGAAFMEEMQRQRKLVQRCPHCGKEIS